MGTAEDPDQRPDPPRSMREIETKFDVPSDFEMPDLGRFKQAEGRLEVDTVRLASSYYDTADLRLLRFRLTVRRREAVGNTTDVGWQLKTPGAGFRTEFHWPLDDSGTPPAELLDLLAPFRDGADLIPAVRLDVERERHRLVTDDGTLVAEVASDAVQVVELEVAARAHSWHEIEIELGEQGKRALLAQIGRALIKAEATSSTSRSKLARAVRGVGNESVGEPRTSAGAVLSDYTDAQLDAIVAGHFAIHLDADESVHQTRVACRRFRSTLRTFSAFFDPDQASHLNEELTWYASVLGEVRDLEVLRTRLAKVVGDLPVHLIVGPVGAAIDWRLSVQLADARAELLAATRSERYTRLLTRLVDWRDNPPFTAAAGRPAKTLAKPVRHAERTLARHLARATDPGGTDAAMHRARKAGKRARYAEEAAPMSGSTKQVRKLQDLLGEFQDSVVAADMITRLAEQARAAGEDTFTYGVLFADQRAKAAAIRDQARR